jgi:hypothetical protein
MIANFINFFSENLLLIQFIIVFVSGILLFFSVYYLVRTNLIGDRMEHFMDVFHNEDIGKRRSLKAWNQIQRRLKTKESDQLKLAVLEADKVLDEILRMSGYPGRNLDERLDKITFAQISNIEELRQAHKLRDRIVSEPAFGITPNEAAIIIEIYKKVFKDFDLIS